MMHGQTKIKSAYSVSFLLSINIFVWQNVLNIPKDLRTNIVNNKSH